MDAQEFALHLVAGKHYGQASACGTKVRYGSEAEAGRHATALNRRPAARVTEAYPCYWCNHWHVGRKMTEEERERFSQVMTEGQADG